jgi:hypothetical protein
MTRVHGRRPKEAIRDIATTLIYDHEPACDEWTLIASEKEWRYDS